MVLLAMRNISPILSGVLVLAGCSSPVILSDARDPAAGTHRLICRERLDCPQQAARLCPGGYEIVAGDTGVIGSLSDLTVSCR